MLCSKLLFKDYVMFSIPISYETAINKAFSMMVTVRPVSLMCLPLHHQHWLMLNIIQINNINFYYYVLQECIKDLNMSKLLSVSMDGPNVNWRFFLAAATGIRRAVWGCPADSRWQLRPPYCPQCCEMWIHILECGKVAESPAHNIPQRTSKTRGFLQPDQVKHFRSTILWPSLGGKSSGGWKGHSHLAKYPSICWCSDQKAPPEPWNLLIRHHWGSSQGPPHHSQAPFFYGSVPECFAFPHNIPNWCASAAFHWRPPGWTAEGKV